MARILYMWKPPLILRSVRSHQHGPIKECMCARVRVCVVVVFFQRKTSRGNTELLALIVGLHQELPPDFQRI